MSIYEGLKSQAEKSKAAAEAAKGSVRNWPAGYHLDDDGFFADIKNDDGSVDPLRLSDPFMVLGEISSTSSGGTGILIGFKTSRGQDKTLLVPLSEVHGMALGKFLADAGLRCDPSKTTMDRLKRFLAIIKPKTIITSVSVAGWHEVEGRFIYLRPNNTAFGAAPVSVFGQMQSVMLRRGDSIDPPASETANYGTSGTLHDWKVHVGLPAIGNTRLAFMIAASFAAPLMRLAGVTSGGIHEYGDSSSGKTVSLIASASVWGRGVDAAGTKAGGLVSSWRATSNGMELLATERNDAPTFLDEIAEMSVRELRQAVYSLLNGSGKRRMTATIGSRDTLKWSTFPISTGEKAISEVLEDDGQAVPGGIEIRMINLPADAGKGLGVLDHYEGASGPAEFINRLQKAAAQFYGTAGAAFLEKLVKYLNGSEEGPAQIKGWAQDRLASFVQQALGDKRISGQITRAAGTFALVAAAGELATRMKILPWPEGEATRAAIACLNAWLGDRGHLGSSDDWRSIADVRLAVSLYGNSRFHPLSKGFKGETPPGGNASTKPEAETDVVSTGGSSGQVRWGYSRDKVTPPDSTKSGSTASTERQYLVYPEVWRRELKISASRKTLIALMIEKKYLDPGNRSDGTRVVKVDGKSQRFFVVNHSILGDD